MKTILSYIFGIPIFIWILLQIWWAVDENVNYLFY